jgi:hypothetical protein
MKKLTSFLLLGLVLFANQCSENNPLGKTGDGKNVKVAFAIPTNAEFTSVASSAAVYVSGPEMDSMYSPMTISESMLYGTINNVPAGIDRKFEVKVFDANGIMQYYGAATTDVEPGITTYVTINLSRVKDGTVVIIGRIIDGEVFVTQPWKPWYASYLNPHWRLANDSVQIDTNYYAPLRFSSGGSTCSDSSPVEYRFSFGLERVPVWSSECWADAPWTCSGVYDVQVQARSADFPDIVSEWSEPLKVRFTYPDRIELLDDTIPDDTMYITTPWKPMLDTFRVGLTSLDYYTPGQFFFRTGGAFCPIDSQIEYRFSMNDSAVTEWTSSVHGSFVFSENGVYPINAQARVASHPNVVSNWSEPLMVKFTAPNSLVVLDYDTIPIDTILIDTIPIDTIPFDTIPIDTPDTVIYRGL